MATFTYRPSTSAGPSRHVYDVIVVGSQLGGTLAGALLAKRGLRVLHVEHDGMGAGYEKNGYTLPYAPFVTPAFKTMPQVEEAFSELGLASWVQRTMKPQEPALQVITAQHRLDFHSDPAIRQNELTRELGEEGVQRATTISQAISQVELSDPFFKEKPTLPSTGILESFQLNRLIARHEKLKVGSALAPDLFPDRLLRQLLPFISYAVPSTQPLPLARTLSQVLRMPHHFPGGREGLREALGKKLTESGGDLLGRHGSGASVVENFHFEGGRVAGIKLMQSDIIYRGQWIIGATDAGALRRLVPNKKKHRRLLEALDSATVQQFLYTVNWVLPERAIPRGMGELVLLETGENGLDPLLLQTRPIQQADAPFQPDTRVVSAGVFVPALVRELGEEHFKELTRRIESHLERLMPFARAHLIVASSPYLDVGGVRGSRFLPHPLLETEASSVLGVTGISMKTPSKNLLIASREVLPGLGLEGEFYTGIRAARRVQDLIKSRQPDKSLRG